MEFRTAGTARMRIDSGGNVGINTSNPTSYGNSQATLVIEDSGSPAIAWSDTGQTRDWFAVAQGSGLYFNYADGGGSGSATNVSEVLVLDNSGNVGIGTSSPSEQLDVQLNAIVNESGAGDKGLFVGPSGNAGSFVYKSSGDAEIAPRSGKSLLFATSTGGTEAMRIDSSGNLLVGTTDLTLYDETNGGETGFALRPDGRLYNSTQGNTSAIFNRIGTGGTESGSILQLRSNGTIVGSIGASSSDLAISSRSDVGIKIFAPSTDGTSSVIHSIKPIAGTAIDGKMSLGYASGRFKDLYLSGGAYLGGTGSANLLDDYEEGTWTPTIVGSTSGSITGFTIAKAVYVKVGDLVHVGVYLSNINMTASTCSGTIQLSNLPFTANSFTGVPLVSFCNMFTFDEADVSISGYVSGNDILLHRGSSTTAISDSDEGTNTAAAIMFSLTYEV
jgi:hypothetical protein